ncbi:hypothetical protein KDQ40_17100 (plasmid) [Haloarcula marismortui ATCC 33800]|uniref:Uncharacterized protein n=1 Tax=Haloarcula marismortui ATCC 33800 TaxID=662476 RepID=A0A8T8KSJ8_9EURY|nr:MULTISPECIES: hypothetical protein [Haloarcula]QUJ74353.1 hypothetical protein KDQ40_17100 [Haloarcula sinaiiensis ATCC 33800]
MTIDEKVRQCTSDIRRLKATVSDVRLLLSWGLNGCRHVDIYVALENE